MSYTVSQLATMSGGIYVGNGDYIIEHLIIDSRSVVFGNTSLFIALKGMITDGHKYIKTAYAAGVRAFLVDDIKYSQDFPNAHFICVNDTTFALQKIAAHHRRNHASVPIIGITGSNGKTIVKEWLASILSRKKLVVKSPKSYNSQIGVPLSIWLINDKHEIGIFEAGVSKYGEMQILENIMKPNIGIFTNIGHAHDEGFKNRDEKLKEKLKLFSNSDTIICCIDDAESYRQICESYPNKNILTWGETKEASVRIIQKYQVGNQTDIAVSYEGRSLFFSLPVNDAPSIQNLMHCITTALLLKFEEQEISEFIQEVKPIAMRLEIKEGRDGCLIINDAYINDLTSLSHALEFQLKHSSNRKNVLVLSEMVGTGLTNEVLIERIRLTLNSYRLDRIVLVGNQLKIFVPNAINHVHYFENTHSAKEFLSTLDLTNNTLLLKGSRAYAFEEIESVLLNKSHSTTLTVDMSAIEQNLTVFASYLQNTTSLICVIKAGAYGSGSEEIAKVLQYKGVDYLAVAFADEGIQLRKAGISTPIMVLNPDETSLKDMVKFRLEPEIYGIHQLQKVIKFLTDNKSTLAIHLKFDTGMSRLGFRNENMEELIKLLKNSECLTINTIFSHLSSSEDSADDEFSHGQALLFESMYSKICDGLGIYPKRHLLNSSGIHRFPQYQYDYVRLGIGLYGIDPNPQVLQKLEKVHTLTAKLMQIKSIKIGESIGYNRKSIATRPTLLAILNIGYADGLLRACGNGNLSVLINGQYAPTVGNICMDLTIVDITDISEAKEGDDAIIFGKEKPIEDLAKAANTIPYEVLTRISPRVRRNFIH